MRAWRRFLDARDQPASPSRRSPKNAPLGLSAPHGDHMEIHMEILLFGRKDGGSSGPVWKMLNASGLGTTTLLCNRKAVNDDTITEAEFGQIMASFKAFLPADQTARCCRSPPPRSSVASTAALRFGRSCRRTWAASRCLGHPRFRREGQPSFIQALTYLSLQPMPLTARRSRCTDRLRRSSMLSRCACTSVIPPFGQKPTRSLPTCSHLPSMRSCWQTLPTSPRARRAITVGTGT